MAISPTGTSPYAPGRSSSIGDYVITYWVDDPVKIVMAVDVRPADH